MPGLVRAKDFFKQEQRAAHNILYCDSPKAAEVRVGIYRRRQDRQSRQVEKKCR